MTHPTHDVAAMFTQAYWDERYGAAERVWSGNPNPQLVAEAADLPPGRALEVGCGEGADALWLAGRGWQVTGVDVSPVVLERCTARAAELGLVERTTWQQADLRTWAPPQRAFDLVSSQFLHLLEPERTAYHRALADAVAPGGTLLVVVHSVRDLATTAPRPHLPELFFAADDVARLLDPQHWEVLVCTTGRLPRWGAADNVDVRRGRA